MNDELEALARRLEIRNRELAEAHSHIATLEEKLLKLKQYRRELRSLKEERRRGVRRPVYERQHERHRQRHHRAQAQCVRLSCSVVLHTEAWRSVFLNRAVCDTASSYIHCGQSHGSCPSGRLSQAAGEISRFRHSL